ncbi:MAG TPA: GNAT family N-acetyltransferase [Polyangia bacterium]
MIRILHLIGDEVAPYRDGLARLEAGISYPIADGADRFRIDHGARYEAFFEGLGEAHFMLAVDGDEVVGTCAGMLRFAEANGRRVPTLYGADFKVAPSHRGGKLARRYLWKGLFVLFRPSVFLRCRLAYMAAMRGRRGDVTRVAKDRISPMKLGRPAARLSIYFVAPEKLAHLDPSGCPPPPVGGIDLSPDLVCDPPGLLSTAGRKDLVLESTGHPWPLVHLPLGPAWWRPSFGHYLRRSGELLGGKDAVACFGLDDRLEDHARWLASQGIVSGAVCTVYALRLPGAPQFSPWVHLATSDI